MKIIDKLTQKIFLRQSDSLSKVKLKVSDEEQAELAVQDEQKVKDLPQLKDYSLVEVVGKGGMGVVYRARHREIDKTMAIKMLHRELAVDPVNIKRFAQEAKAASLLTHPNLCSIYDSGTAEDGQPYLIMDFLDGKTLEEIIHTEGFLDLDRFLNIFGQVCEALVHAHRKGVIHRDLKPSNIMIMKADEDSLEFVKLVDFGIARVFQEVTKDGPKVTQTGDVIGSPTYMSPEQCLGVKLDERSDIYSLGVVMYEALTGKAPFGGDNAIQTILHHVQDKAIAISTLRPDLDLPPGLEKLIMKALEKKPENRQQSMTELQSEFDWIRDTLHAVPSRHKSLDRAMRKMRIGLKRALKSRKQIAIAAGTIVLLGLGLFAYAGSFVTGDWVAMAQKGEVAAMRGDLDQAMQDWRSALVQAERVGAPPKDKAQLNMRIAQVLLEKKTDGQASDDAMRQIVLPYLKRALELYDSQPGIGPPPVVLLSDLAFNERLEQDYAGAEKVLRRQVAQMEGEPTPLHEYVHGWSSLGLVLSELGRTKEAEAAFMHALAAADKSSDSTTDIIGCGVLDHLIPFYMQQFDWKDAEKFAREQIIRMRKINHHKAIGKFDGERLISILEHQGKVDEARQVRAQIGNDP